jgi:hypothetical protein
MPRAIFLWIVVRVTIAGFLAVPRPGLEARTGLQLLSVGPATAALIAAVVAVLVLTDVRALRERAFLANLGISRSTAAAVAFLTSLGLEAVTAVILGLIS